MHQAWIIFVISSFFYASLALARFDVIPGSRYTSGRAAAMGDAFLPLGDDVASGLFYNPAGLGKLRHDSIEPLNMSFYGSNVVVLNPNLGMTNIINLGSYSSTIQASPGRLFSAGGALFPNARFLGISFGILANGDMNSQAAADGSITYRSLYQIIPAIGFGFRLFNGVLRMGYSLQWVNQAFGGATVASGESMSYGDHLYQGSGLSHMLGVALTLPMKLLPSVNFVVRNMFHTVYGPTTFYSFSNNSIGEPAPEGMTYDGSLSINPRLGQGALLHLSGVYRDMSNVSSVDLMGHLAFGAELVIRDRINFRGGWRGGYMSAGFGIRKPGSEISLTWYTEEVGRSFMNQGDERFMLQYQTSF